jgi:hypothetical protein
MTNAKLDVLIWVLVYGGLLLLSLGLFVRRTSEPFGWTLIVIGALLTVAGTLLVWVRSRRGP